MSTSASHTQSELQDYSDNHPVLFPVVHLDIPECAHCETWRNPNGDVKGSYCSRDCWLRSKGQNVLTELQHDHTICATCFRVIKEIECPPEGTVVNIPTPDAPHNHGDADGVKNVLIGYQYETPATERAVDDFSTDPYRVQERTRWSCECGNVDPNERDDILEEIDLDETIIRLLQRLRERYEMDQLPNQPSKQRLFDALREEWRDWEYAIGSAVWG